MNVGKTVRLGLLGRNYNMTVDLPAPQWLLDLAAMCADSTVDTVELRVLECPELPELARPPWPKPAKTMYSLATWSFWRNSSKTAGKSFLAASKLSASKAKV